MPPNINILLWIKKTFFGQKYAGLGHTSCYGGGGLVVSLLAFNSANGSSNLADAYLVKVYLSNSKVETDVINKETLKCDVIFEKDYSC